MSGVSSPRESIASKFESQLTVKSLHIVEKREELQTSEVKKEKAPAGILWSRKHTKQR